MAMSPHSAGASRPATSGGPSPAKPGAPQGPGTEQHPCSCGVLWGTVAGYREAWPRNEGSDTAQMEGRGPLPQPGGGGPGEDF